MLHHVANNLCVVGNMCSLQSLGLGGNEIHDEGVIHLVQALKTNTRLRSLGLGGNQIGKTARVQIGFVWLVNFICYYYYCDM